MSTRNERNKPVAPARRRYERPALRAFGSIQSLTAGGSAGVNEAMVGGMNMSKVKI